MTKYKNAAAVDFFDGAGERQDRQHRRWFR